MAKSSFVPPGTVLMGKYRVERELGSGGMGVVVEATHVGLNQRVAIKLLNPDLVGMPEILGRFLREARIAATLPGDHIARATDVGQTEAGVPYLVMELLAGHDFEVEIKRTGRFEIARAVALVLEACEGVADAHAVGLVHRDLKPANLFLAHRGSRPPVVKVLDFGLSKEPKQDQSVALTQDGSIFGTPQYMSPEQVISTKDVDARSDQHALAMILFEALTGRTPYEGTTVNQLIVAIATATPPRLRELRKDVPAGLDEAVARALAKKPADRFPTLAGFAQAIAPFGGAAALASASNIERTLRGGQALLVASADASASSEHAKTIPILAPGTSAPSEVDLTSSLDPTRLARRSRRRLIAGAAVAAMAALALFVVLHFRATPVTAIEASGAVTPTPAAPPPADSSAVTASVPIPASATLPLPSASAPTAKRVKPASPHVLQPAPAVSRAIGVFGERTK